MVRSATEEALLEAARGLMRISLHAADGVGDVSVVQLRALTVLDHLGQANLGALAARMGVTPSTTSRLVDRLVVAGLVERATAEHSRREVTLRLTTHGRATLQRYDDLRLAALHGLLAALPDPEREVALRGLLALGSGAAAVGRS